MAFLDNSGDIILDAVLTDTGRFRLAKGDGSFKISKFAFGDDEINYGSYNRPHTSGSAYYDLDVLQTPVLEAFTNNTSTMNSKLITIPRTNLLFLPILKLNTLEGDATGFGASAQVPGHKTTGDTTLVAGKSGSFFVSVDSDTEALYNGPGVMLGANLSANGSIVRVDQGLDTTEIPSSFSLDPDLVETNYIIQMDNRLGQLTSPNGSIKNPRFIDDDNIAFYYISAGTDSEMVADNDVTTDSTTADTQVISGPRGTVLRFAIASSIELQTSTFLFNELGSTMTLEANNAAGTVTDGVRFIDTNVRIQGATTGYSLDIKVRYIKQP